MTRFVHGNPIGVTVMVAFCAMTAALLAACGGGDSGGTPSATADASATIAADTATAAPSPTTSVPTATAEASPVAAVPAAPSAVSVTGAIPDLRTPVPPGQGELGRITVQWTDNSGDEDGFRIYQDCGSGDVSKVTDVPANETQIGPIQVCRPGRVGVASFNASGESEIAWAS
jgi:hypothetical protein